jgi:two-component system sensor histidine kinase CpxA
LQNLMGEYKTKLPANGYLFNEAGVDVLGRKAPAEVTALIRQPVDSRQIEVKISMSHTLVLSPATGPSGAAYRFVGIIPRQPGSIVPVFGWNWGWGIGISILVLSAVCFAIARSLTSPVIKLRSAARRIAAGDLGVRVTDGALKARRDEFTELGEDFDAMASQIEKLVSGKQQLLWDISHELRSPLTRLSLALSIARRKCSPGTASALDRMERETEQLNGLIEQLLTLARISGGTGPSLTDKLDLEEVVREIAGDAAFEASAMNRSVTWTADVQGHVSGARELLRSALENVVRNALRYTPEETDVTIHLGGSKEPGMALISVRDRGPGVPEASLDRLFETFYRVPDLRIPECVGAGLGLAITRQVVEAHGGWVKARNSEAGGLEVQIALPIRVPAD